MIVSFTHCLEPKLKFGRYYLGMVGWNIVSQVENYVKAGTQGANQITSSQEKRE